MTNQNKPQQIFDELLVLEAQGGDRNSWSLLVQRWHHRLLRQAYRHVGDRAVAQDITQEVWQVIVQDIAKLRDPSRFGFWALSIVSRRSFSWIKKQRKHRSTQMEVADESKVVSELEEDEGSYLPYIREGLQQLSVDQRLVVEMYYLENLSVSDISKILGVPQGTVKSRLYHAREHLREILNTIRNGKE